MLRSPVGLAKCACCRQWRPVPLYSNAAFGMRYHCRRCDWETQRWLEREMGWR